MNQTVTFFVGLFTFLVVMALKIPVKKINWKLSGRRYSDPEKRYLCYRRYNFSLFFLVMAVSVGSYYVLYRLVQLDHFKLCCTLKAGAMAIAIYAVDEQWSGSRKDREKK